MTVHNVRKELRRAKTASRRNTRVRANEVERLSQLVERRKAKLDDAKRRLTAAKERADA